MKIWSGASIRAIFYLVLLLPFVAVSSENYLKEFSIHRQTRYFDFYFVKESETNGGIVQFADGYIDIINRDFFKADFDYPIRVLVLEDRAHFKAFLQREFGIKETPNFGIYLYQYKLFATYGSSGLGTFAHEIMHPLVESNLKNRAVWAIEGIPTFFEKFYGYWADGKLVAFWGYQNPWRIEALGSSLTSLNLKDILSATDSPGKYNESDRRMVSMFLWKEKRFKRFLQLIKQKDMQGYGTYFEAAMEMPMDKIVPSWERYLVDVSDSRGTIATLPASTILPDKGLFNEFAEKNQISTKAQ